MKLTAPPRSTSFYESFSDLIFATMAIFVLIMIVLIIQVRPKVEDPVETQPLELVIAVDGSGSMGEPLSELRDAIIAIAESVPIISGDFRLNIIIYRSELTSLGMQQIYAERDDNGTTLNTVRNFMGNLVPIGGPARIDLAISEALASFSEAGSRQALFVLGDVGPYETHSQATCDEPALEQQLRRSIETFAQSRDEFDVFALYSGPTGSNAGCYAQSEAFFQSIGNALGEKSSYSNDPSRMFVRLLEMIVGKR